MAIDWKQVRLRADTIRAVERVQTSLETAVGNGQLELPYSDLYGVSLDATVAHLCKLYARKAERRRKAQANRCSGKGKAASSVQEDIREAWGTARSLVAISVYAPLEGEVCGG